MPTTSVLISGVGGQGVVLVSELLALAALAAGEDVKQGEFHGVAQRGGAVFSHVRFGDKVHSPMAPLATVDYLVALEKLEALRYAHYLKPAGTVIINEHTVEPVRLADQRPYPDDAVEFLTGKGFDVVPVAATELAIELGNHRAANVVLLGALAEKLEIPSEIWEQTIEQRIPERFLSLNQAAFAAGREAIPSSVGTA
jgi:indolepyruvate ferredoxin oxidoreductase beta subunit